MNESYLNRKIFSKLKRTRTQPSNQSLSSATSRAQDSELDDNDDQQQQQPDQEDQQEASRSNGEAATGEEEEDKIRTRGEPKRAESTAGSVSPPDSQPSTSCSGDQTTSDNLLFVNGGHHHNNSRGHPEPQSKLRTRSRAVWLFIRAASSLTSSTNASQDNSAASASRVGRRLGSLAPRMRHSSSCTASASNLNGDEQPAGATCLPRFIVPKMNALNLPIVCLVKSLEGELMREVFVHRYELGQYLIDSLKASLGLKDSKYFGLKMAKSLDDQEDVRQPWLDLNESICKQISKQKVAIVQSQVGGANPTTTTTAKSICFYLRIKFYPPNLARIQDAFLRRYLWLQLRRDLRLGKLTSSMNNLTLLMACVLQHELGDYQADLVERLPELNILPNQDLIEEQAIEVWKTRLINSKKHQVLMQFLRAAVILETYGFDYYPVRDHQRQRAYLLGFNYNGIKTIRNGRIIHHFRWHSLNKVSYERRMIIFHIYPTENSKRKQILGFKCLSNDDCQNLYMRLLEQKYFFTVDLTYFDKSVRRPSCLEASQSAVALDWSAIGSQSEEHQRQQQQQQQRFGSTSNSIGDFNTTQSHLNGSFDQDVEFDQTNFDDDEEEEEEDDDHHHHYDGQEQRNGCDCDDYDLAGDYRNHRASTATSNWPQSSATSGHHDHHHFQHHSQRASFSRPSAHNNNNNNLDAAGQAGSLHRSPIPTDGQHGQSNNETRHLYGPANFTKSSSLQEQSSQRAPPLGAKEGQQNNGTLTLFSSPEGEPAPGAPGPPPAPNQQQQQLPVPISSHQIRHHHQAEPDNGSHAPLQRQHSTLVYAGASINRPSWQAPAGHANSKPGRDQIDLDDKNNTPVEEGDDDGPRQQSGQAAGGEGQPSGGLLDNLLASLLVVVGGGGGGGADLASPSGGQQREGAQQQQSMILLAVRFCLLILLMNFLLRLTDGLSGALVDLLTIPGRGGGGSGASTGNVAD